MEERADGKAADVPTGVSYGDCATAQQRTVEQIANAPAEKSHAKDPSVQQRTKEPLIEVETVQQSTVEEVVHVLGEPFAPAGGLDTDQLNGTLLHRDVRMVEGPIAWRGLKDLSCSPTVTCRRSAPVSLSALPRNVSAYGSDVTVLGVESFS